VSLSGLKTYAPRSQLIGSVARIVAQRLFVEIQSLVPIFPDLGAPALGQEFVPFSSPRL
jgi:hypothetical protein